MSWSLVDTWTITIDDTTKTISFTLLNLFPSNTETLSFKTTATGPVWSINKTTVSLESAEGPWANWVSNKLIIVAVPSSWGGGGGGWLFKDYCPDGDYSNNYYDWRCWIKPSTSTWTVNQNNTGTITQNNTLTTNLKNPVINKDNLLDTLKKMTLDNNILKTKIIELDNLTKSIENSVKKWISQLIKLPKILPKTWTPISDKVKTKLNPKVVTSLQSYVENKDNIINNDLNYRKAKLPYEQDKNAWEYLVAPSVWLVIPIINVPNISTDYKKLIDWNEINFNNYLQNWAMKYAWTSSNSYWEDWNTVIFWHSSYFTKDNWRYKTAFQAIIGLDPNEEVWIYKKLDNNEFKQYKYKVEKSYNVKPTQTDILLASGWKELTLFTCTPIWWIEWRWVIKAKYIEDTTNTSKIDELKKEIYWDASLKAKRVTAQIALILNKYEEKKKKLASILLYNKALSKSFEKIWFITDNDYKYLENKLLNIYFN
jgi:LPXTG-site transpeptidase (sortase) family protein